MPDVFPFTPDLMSVGKLAKFNSLRVSLASRITEVDSV